MKVPTFSCEHFMKSCKCRGASDRSQTRIFRHMNFSTWNVSGPSFTIQDALDENPVKHSLNVPTQSFSSIFQTSKVRSNLFGSSQLSDPISKSTQQPQNSRSAGSVDPRSVKHNQETSPTRYFGDLPGTRGPAACTPQGGSKGASKTVHANTTCGQQQRQNPSAPRSVLVPSLSQLPLEKVV